MGFSLLQKKIELVNTVVYYVRHGNSQVKNAEETHLFPMFKWSSEEDTYYLF